MASTIIALLGLCLAFVAHGAPANVLLPPVQPSNVESGSLYLEGQLNGGGVEGDMIFPPGVDPKSSARGVAIYGSKQWPNGTVPYDMSAITDPEDQQIIIASMNTLMYAVGTPIINSDQRKPCVSFRPSTPDDKVYLKIQYGNGCNAHVGYITHYQPKMNLIKNSGPNYAGCFYKKVIQHELLHVLGFFHEQSRPDRDTYLEVNLENVDPSMVSNFNKYTWGSDVLNQGSPYDYASIMHYTGTAFSANGKPTMIPRQAGVAIGQNRDLSATDIVEVRHFYGCEA